MDNPHLSGDIVLLSHPLCSTHFGQYQTSSAALEWLEDGDCYLMHGIQLDSWPHSCNSYKFLKHNICSCTSVTSIYMYVGLWSLIIHACVLETKVTKVIRECSMSCSSSCLLLSFSTCPLCCSLACSCRLENDTAFFPLNFHYLEDKGLQGELWGKHMLVHYSTAGWWPYNMGYNIVLNCLLIYACTYQGAVTVVTFATYPFCFSVAVEMIANKLFQQFLDQMEAKVSG